MFQSLCELCNDRYIPFSFLETLKFDSAKHFISGGCAAYMHIFNKLNKKIHLANIDLCIVKNDYSYLDSSEIGIFEELVQKIELFCEKNNCTYEITNMRDSVLGTIDFYQKGKKCTAINFFIGRFLPNEVPIIERINGLNIENFENCCFYENKNLELCISMTEGDGKTTDLSEYEMFMERKPRKQEIVHLFEVIKGGY